MEITVDNRIILALAEVAGTDRELDNIFVLVKKGKALFSLPLMGGLP